MSRAHNFSAGPAVLPESVIAEAQRDLWEFDGTGIGIAECSHRSAMFDGVVERCQDRIRRLLRLDEDQKILFLQGGARTQFWMWPANMLRGGRATYLDTGLWSEGAIKDARRYGTVDVPFSSKPSGWDHVPAPGAWGPLPDGTAYLHYTSNNTVAGSEFSYVPEAGDVPLVCDMSSNILSREVDGSRFAMIYAGAQKNLGPSGVTLVIVRESLVERMEQDLPEMVRYGVQIAKNSMLNTPCTFGIYMIERVTAWIEEMGGLSAIEARNVAQAEQVYTTLAESALFSPKVREGSRSRMNITFTTGDADLDARFVKAASAAGLSGLKGHRSVGGLRASLYNAQTNAAVDALCSFLRDFEREHGRK